MRAPAGSDAFGSATSRLSLLDLRTYRSRQAQLAVTPVPSPDGTVSDSDRTITGDAQMRWLKESLRQDRAQWKLVGNPVMIARSYSRRYRPP